MMVGMGFTIRDLFWLVLVAAIGFGWARSDRKRMAEVQAARDNCAEQRSKLVADIERELRRYEIAALNPSAYEDWLRLSEAERQTAIHVIAKQLGVEKSQLP